MNSIHQAEPISVLSISTNENDHASLSNIFGHSRWVIVKAPDAAAAQSALERHDISVIVCDCDSTAEQWKEILDGVPIFGHGPKVILTSRLADDQLWSQALHLGAWDVLPKPLRAADVVRSVRYAWEHWRDQRKIRSAGKAMSAVG